jgi:hypothetical protein
MFKTVSKSLSRESVKGWLGMAMAAAEQCIECNESERKCPFSLPISDLFKENLVFYIISTYALSFIDSLAAPLRRILVVLCQLAHACFNPVI